MSPLTERHVQAIWYDAALRPRNLATRRGTPVEVISPGDWNLGPGPDFRNAVLAIGRERRRIVGDVEVHLCPSDWDLHGHGANPNYRNVIAHVTWIGGPDPQTTPPGAITVWIGRFVTADTAFSPDRIDLEAYPFARLPIENRPCELAFGRNPDLARPVLIALGERRLRLKARRLLGRLCAAEADRYQIFYEEVMTALGYRLNQTPFRHVAERCPIAHLPVETAAAETALLSAGSFETWARGRSRPFNLPEQRLRAAAVLLTATPVLRLIDAVDFTPEGCRGMLAVMCGGRALGRGRAAAILANVILPFALAEGRQQRIPGWLPPEDLSEPVRLTAFRLFGRDHNPAAFYAANGLLIQGILQTYRDFCLQNHPACEHCALIHASTAE